MTGQADTPEIQPKNAAVAVRVTASEKRDVVLVAVTREIPESEVMRTLTISEITTEAARIRAAVAQAA